MDTPVTMQLIDEFFPPRGPCAFCGGGDARHRVLDAIAERFHAGDSEESIAEDHGISLEAVRVAVAAGQST